MTNNYPVIGHIHLKVSDLERSIKFYTEVLGFDITMKFDDAAFLSFGGYHHHLGLNTWESFGGNPPPRKSTGLYHFAILYPTIKDLAYAFKRLIDNNFSLDGAADHGVSIALYLHDPDENGIELYWDREPSQWPKNPDGTIEMYTKPLNLKELLKEAE